MDTREGEDGLYFDQSPYDVRFDWGERGLEALGPGSDTIIIVDVLSFSTAVDVAVSRGASVLPYRRRDQRTGRRGMAPKGTITAPIRAHGRLAELGRVVGGKLRCQ